MDPLTTILQVLRALLDAAFSGGTITDAAHTDLQAKLDAADPAVAAAAAEAEYKLTDAEAAELERLQAKQANAPAIQVDVPTSTASGAAATSQVYGGTEGSGFGG